MEHWQFLIQKQGDRSWSPIESPNIKPNIKIVEGYYRVLAHSDLINTDVEVRVTHSSTLELPPKRRIQKRSRRTNSEGLIAVIPFTYFKPGVWGLCCSSDLVSHFLGQPWQHCIQLEVLPKVAVDVRQNDKEKFPVFTDELPKEKAIIEQPITPVWLKSEKVEYILQNLIEIALPDSELLLEDDKPIEDFPSQIPESLLVLKLQEEIYTCSWGQTFTINGRVEPKETTNQGLSITSNEEKVYGGEIRIELRSPQDSKIIRRVRQSLPEKLIPFHIRCSVEVPADCESKLILGEISLYSILTIGGHTTLLTNQFFTITADVTELLAISTTARESEPNTIEHQLASSAALATSEAKKLSTPLDLKLFNLVKTPKKARSLLLQPSPKKSLPPRINPKSHRKSQSHRNSAAISPQLPKFVQHQNRMINPALFAEPSSKLESDRESTVTAVRQVISMDTTFPYLRRLEASQDETEDITRSEPIDFQQHTTEIHSEDTAKSVVEDTQFQNESLDEDAAKLATNYAQTQDTSFVKLVIPPSSELIAIGSPNISPLIRRWMHTQGYSLPEPIYLENQDYDIYTISSQDQLSDEVNTEVEEQVAIETQGDKSIQNGLRSAALTKFKIQNLESSPSSLLSHSQPTARCANTPSSSRHERTLSARLAQEIVVENTFDEAETFKNQPDKQEESISEVSVCLPVVVEITEPLPVPQLHLPSGELISGKSVRIRVQLPTVSPEVVVKLWVEDCQTRWLIDEPRLLTNLLPNSAGWLEDMTSVIVPFGCLEIRLEAIALNTVTQQESHKVSIQRTVIPPGLPTLQLDEVFGI
ncbi:MAG: hypothetical protein KME30_20850 [Iphinoe sp. HA4291-MV1]|jgi:hypothetical protein|nr:hypothetical protein [Iphinoe sp. HA4291-MV1]